jgi:UDP-N-acetylmuramoyl-tripeptide--D-alanyl-D-alanine ligase
MLIILSLSFIAAASIIFFSRRLLRYLYHFQEGGYSRRYLKNWIVENGVYDKKGTFIAAIAAILIEFIGEHNQLLSFVISAIGAGSLIWLGFWEDDPRKVGTPKLQSSDRAIGIHNLALALYSIACTLSMWGIHVFTDHEDLAPYWLTVIVGIQSSPIWLVIARTMID